MESIDWNRITSPFEREMIQDAYDAMIKADAYDVFANPCSDDKDKLDLTDTFITYEGHSGFSYTWTIGQVRSICQNGFDRYIQMRLEYEQERK